MWHAPWKTEAGDFLDHKSLSSESCLPKCVTQMKAHRQREET